MSKKREEKLRENGCRAFPSVRRRDKKSCGIGMQNSCLE